MKQIRRTFSLLSPMIATFVLLGCGGSNAETSQAAKATSAVAASSAEVAATVPTTIAETTGTTVAGSEVVTSLAADSPTCKAITQVRDLNEKSGASVNEFTQAIFPVEGESRTPAEIEEAFETFLRKFEANTAVVLPELTDAYATLGKAQPQFKTDLAGIEKVTVGLLKTLSGMKGSDLDKFDEIVATALPQAELFAAGEASLKIDKFARAACGVPFANT